MNLVTCGINHQTAPLAVREQLIFDYAAFPASLQDLLEHTQAQEALILSTCNRTELYCAQAQASHLIAWLHNHKQLSQNSLNPYLYSYQGFAALRHLLRVASGLDSMVVGEAQILAQLKTAFSLACAAGTIGSQLQRLFQYVFSVSKEVRTQTTIGRYPVSIAFAAVDLAKHIFADLATLEVLLLGAGNTIELVAKHFVSRGVKRIWIANRTYSHADRLAQSLLGRSVSLDAVPECLTYVDMVITATASPLPLLTKEMVKNALKQRKHRPLLMIDLALPRDIEPEIAQLPDVYLYNLDDLQVMIQQNLGHRSRAAAQAELIISTKVSAYGHSLAALEAVPLVTAYRQQAERLRDTELAKALSKLQSGVAVEQVVKSLARHLTNKLIHTPSVELRKVAYTEQKEFLAIAAQLLGLQVSVNQAPH